ncbi:hypothetical protein PANA5342_pPANA10286 (plasmid) [Pantoea ananatis LMG 5342]|nr:hypothetical protein PANA5342_pPANA10286 [Pantoea ananatis LMG 5342]
MAHLMVPEPFLNGIQDGGFSYCMLYSGANQNPPA